MDDKYRTRFMKYMVLKACKGFISDVTGKLTPKNRRMAKQTQKDVFPVVFINPFLYSGIMKKLEAYVIFGIS